MNWTKKTHSAVRVRQTVDKCEYYFVEDKERDEVYVSTDGFHYDLIPLNEKENVTAMAYRWMFAWLRR